MRANRLFSADDFRQRALAQDPEASQNYGDHMLNPAIADLLFNDTLHDAAVLVPVIDRGNEATVLLTQRSSRLNNHPGQIAFPGGRIDPEDQSPRHAALREANEEVGLDPSLVEIVGQMPHYTTGSGYRILPVLSVVKPDFKLVINEDEVDDVFEVPLSFLMNPANHERGSRLFKGYERFYFKMPYEKYLIWGITAGILHMLYERLYHK